MSDKKITLTSPRGTAVYPRLKTPDTKFDELGAYKADLRVPVDEAQGLISEINKLYRDWVGKPHPKNPERDNKNAVYYIETNDEGEETGFVVFKFRVKNKTTKKGDLWDRRPAQFIGNSKTPLTTPKNVGGGTVMRVSFEVYRWQTPTGTKGVSLQPEAVKILSLREFDSQRDASAYGFGDDDDADDFSDEDTPFDDDDDDGDASAGDSVPADEDGDY